MTFGLPAMIHESYLTLDLPITDMKIVGQPEDPSSQAETTSPAGPTPQMDGLYYTATIKLYNVMHRTIDTCYGQNLGLEEPAPSSQQSADYSALFSHVLRVEAELESWKAQLAPNQLSVYDVPVSPKDLEGIEADEKISARYVVVFSVRYHILQILSHRPILEKLLETCGRRGSSRRTRGSTMAATSSKLLQMGLGSVEACIHSAQAIISIVHTIVLADGPRRDLLGARNFSLFYTFNAALAIFAAMHVARCDVQRNMGDDPATLSRLLPRWEFVEAALPYFGMAIEALENLDRGNRVVERCVSYLSQLLLVPINPGQQLATNENGHSRNSPQTGPAMAPDQYGQHNQGQTQGPSGYPQGYPPHHGHVHAHQHPHTMAMSGSAAVGNSGPVLPRQPQQLLPTEIDLNEFMLDTDFDLLNMAWLSS